MLVRILNPRNWPYWFKLTLSMFLILLTGFVLLLNAYEVRARAEAETLLREYLQQEALTRKDRLENELQSAFSTIREAAGVAYLRPRLLRMLNITGTPSVADIVARSEATDLLRFRLVENNIFEYVRVLTPEGVVVASVFPPEMPAEQRDLVGADNSQSPGYRGALDAQTLGESQRLIVYINAAGENQAEVVQVIEFDQEIVGFMIGRLNLQNTLVRNITDVSGITPFNIVSYLATRSDAVIVSPAFRTQAVATLSRSQKELALAGQVGFTDFSITSVPAPIISYYQPVSDTPLALITYVVNDWQPGNLTLGALGGASIIPIVLFAVGAGLVALIWFDTRRPLELTRRIFDTGLDEEMQFELSSIVRGDMFGQLARDALNIRKRYQESYHSLTQRLAANLRDIEATQEVGRFVSTQRDQQALMNEVVNLIINVFGNIYHAQIFLNDELNEYAVLRASTGEAGRRLLERGHRLPVGGTSVVGRTTGEGVVTAVLDTEASDVHRKNELLPNTRAELAIPLRLGTAVIGAVDVQSFTANSFTNDQITTLQAMSDQIAIAIENARLYQESVRALDEIAKRNREDTDKTWREHLFNVRTQELVAWAGTPTRTETDSLREQAIKTGVTQIGRMTGNRTIPVAVPIVLRGQPLGAVVWELPAQEYSDEKVALAEELVNRLSITLDNARLFEESQRAAERERVLNDIAAKITAQADVESILSTAVREVGQALRTTNVRLKLGVEGAQRKGKNAPVLRLDNTNGHGNGNGNGSHE